MTLSATRTCCAVLVCLLSACEVDDCLRSASQFPNASHTTATRVSLAAVCGQAGCPADAHSAILRVMQHIAMMPGGCNARVVTGCGVESVQESWPAYSAAWHYDTKTGRLIGADHSDDTQVTLEGCKDVEFVAGVRRPVCAHASERSLCPAQAGDAGAENDAGSAP
jgi:hypothetical protein